MLSTSITHLPSLTNNNSPINNLSPLKSTSSQSFARNFGSTRPTTRTTLRVLSPTQIMLERYERKHAARSSNQDLNDLIVHKA